MKRIFIIAALMAATIGASAQHLTDTLATLQDLRNVSSEMERINKGLKTHSVMVASGGVLMLCGILTSTKNGTPAQMQQHAIVAKSFVVVGAALIVASVMPLPKNVQLDERGIVIPIGKKDNRK